MQPPVMTSASCQQALQLLQAQRFHEAAAWLHRYLQQSPGDIHARWLLAGALMRDGAFKEANEAARECTRLAPRSAPAHALLGEILACQSRMPEAERALNHALRLAPTQPHVAIVLVQVLQQQEKHEEALACVARYATILAPATVAALRAYSLRALRRLSEAIVVLRDGQILAPKDPILARLLASSLLETGDAARAENVALTALQMHPGDLELKHVKAAALIAQRDFEGADATLRDVLHQQPHDDAARINLAEVIWLQTGDVFQAVAVLDEAPGIASSELQVFKARVLEWAGRQCEALEMLEKSLRREPESVPLRVAAAQCAVRLDANEALAHARMLAKLDDGPVALLTLGNALLATGNTAEADRIARRMLAWDSHDGHALALLASTSRAQAEPVYRQLYDFNAFVRADFLDVPRGWPSLNTYLDDLSRVLLKMHTLAAHPIGQTLRGGTQVDLTFDETRHPVIFAFAEAVRGPIDRYIAALGRGSDPLRTRNTGRWKLNGMWSVKLRPNGRHVNHYHPAGWLSSACYIHVPSRVGAMANEGWLAFGESGIPTQPAMGAEYFVRPQQGLLVLFPAWMWHGTIPFSGTEDDYRLTIAFDVLPA